MSLKHCLATKKAYKNQKETLNAQITIKLLFYFERRIRNNCPFTQCISSIHVELISISKYGNETPLFDRIKNSKLQTQTENGDIKKIFNSQFYINISAKHETIQNEAKTAHKKKLFDASQIQNIMIRKTTKSNRS